MRRFARALGLGLIAISLQAIPSAAGGPPPPPLKKCPPDAVVSGTVCMDVYEASVWRIPEATGANARLVKRIQLGKAKLADLVKGGATQLGLGGDNYAPCSDNGQDCADDIYALSLPGVTPSAHMTWFQAQQACKNARKRLPTNAEWQAAVAGTPNPGPDDGVTDCATAGVVLVPSGSRSECVSTDGVFDMVGNNWEWVADWVPLSTTTGSWPGSVDSTGDYQLFVGASESGEPAALLRGGGQGNGAQAGPLAIVAGYGPSATANTVGFRCAR